MTNNKINISKLKLVVKENCIGFEGMGIGELSNTNVPSNKLKESYEYIISKYPSLEKVLLIIANIIINNNFSPCGIIIMLCYYLKVLEDKEINTINLINEFKKHKKDPDYLLSSLSVPKIGYYLANQNIDFEFPKNPKKIKGIPSPDLIINQNGNKLKADVKGRGVAQLKRLAYEFKSVIENPNQPSEWHSFEEGIVNELKHSELRRIIKKAFLKQKVDILIIDETNNLFQIGGVFMLSEMDGQTEKEESFKPVKNNIVFCSNFGGKFKCFQIDKDIFLKDTLPDDIKDRVPKSCDKCSENNIVYWKEDKEDVIFKCQKCGVTYSILFEQNH